MTDEYYTTSPPSSYLTFHRRLLFLEDVNIANPTNGQVIAFNSTTGKWANSAGGGGGGGGDNIGTGTSLIRTTATTGFSGEAADQEANGGIVLDKNFITRDGTTNNSYSQSLVFGPTNTDGSWRIVAIQDTNGTQDTILSIQLLQSGVWTSVTSWNKKGITP